MATAAGAGPVPDGDDLRVALDEHAIARLQAAYGDVVTRRAWGELHDLFAPDCPVRIDLRDGRVLERTGPAALGELVAASLERFDLFVFTLLNAVATVDAGGDTATGRVYLCEVRTEAATGAPSLAYGLYEDRYARLDGRWVFAERRYSSLARSAAAGGGFDVFGMP